MPVQAITSEMLQGFKQDGWRVSQQSSANLFGSSGKRYRLSKEMSSCDKFLKMLGCCISIPCCCCVCCKPGGTLSDCEAASNGKEELDVFVVNKQATRELEEADKKELGFDPNDVKSMQAYVETQEEGGVLPIQSRSCPQHHYMIFHGPSSNWSYILLIPNGNRNKIQCQVWYKESSGESYNSGEMVAAAERICANYNPSQLLTRIDRSTAQTLRGEINGPFGPFRVYENREVQKPEYQQMV